MPLGIIKELELPESEQKRIDFVKSLRWPENKIIISRLSSKDFLRWIYALEPREAMLIMGTQEYKDMADKRGNIFFFLFNPIWRLINGVPL